MSDRQQPLEAQLRAYGEVLDGYADRSIAPRATNRSFVSQSRPPAFTRRSSGLVALGCGVLGLIGTVVTLSDRRTATITTEAPSTPVSGSATSAATAIEPTTLTPQIAVSSDATTTTATPTSTSVPSSVVGQTSVAPSRPSLVETTTATTAPPRTTTPVTVAPTTTQPSLTTATTVVQPTTTTTTVKVATTTAATLTTKQAAARLPHLQLDVTGSQLGRPYHQLSGRTVSGRTDAAVISSWNSSTRHAYLVVANVSVRISPTRGLIVRNQPAAMTNNGELIEIRWVETSGVTVALTTSGFTDAEARALANGIIEIGAEPWTVIVNNASALATPNPWESVLVDNTI